MEWPPHLTVATVIEQDGKFLVVEEEIDGKLVINQPAGHLEPGESLFEAARRETLEETGWEVELTGICGLYHYKSNPEHQIHRTVFVARAIRETGQPLDPDITRTLWLSRDELGQHTPRSPLVLMTVDDYLAGAIAPLSMLRHID